jgi:putative transposase
MRKSKFNEEQIVKILNSKQNGLKVDDVCRQHGISQQTFYRWQSKYGGMEAADVKRLKSLEDENRKLKQLLGEKELDISALKAALEGNYH